MPERIYISVIQLWESYRTRGIAATIHDICYRNREVIVLENDLRSLGPPMEVASGCGMDFLEVSRANFAECGLQYPLRSRYLKARSNLENGYECFLIRNGGEVVGDMWCATSVKRSQKVLHPDLKWLRVACEKRDVYIWDTYVTKEARRGGVGSYLISLSLHRLRERGVSRVYGYVVADNRPALFLYKVFRFSELKRLKVDRFFLLKRVRV